MTTIFISASGIDLKDHVAAVKDALEDAGFQVAMADFSGQSETPRQASLREVEGADWFVGVYARRCGYIPEGEELSITEQEYHHARLTNKPVFAFIVDDANSDLSPGPGEEGDSAEARTKRKKQGEFLARIRTAHVRETLTDAADLRSKVLASLSRYEKRQTIQEPPVNTLRIRLEENRVRLFHNDLPLATSASVWDVACQHLLEDCQKATRPAEGAKNARAQRAGVAEAAAAGMGALISGVLFEGDAAKSAEELLSAWRKKGERGQVALEIVGGEWERRPLETITAPGSQRPLALTRQADLFRIPDKASDVDCPDIDGPLKILMVVAAPWTEDAGTAPDHELELGKVMDIVERLPDFARLDRRPIVHILDQGSLGAICEAFRINRYHVLHISAHGRPGALSLETEDGGVDEVAADDFAARFPAGREPVLTVLGARRPGSMGELAGFAGRLVHHGFAYAAAMRTAVSDRYATQFAEVLYCLLAYNDRPVIEAAFTDALIQLEDDRVQQNKKLPLERQIPPEWMAPALYKSGIRRHVVYDPRPERRRREMETPTETFDPRAVHRKAGGFVGRREELMTLKRRVLAEPGGAALVVGMGGVGKSTLAARAIGDQIKKGALFTLTAVVGRISLVDLLQEFGCRGRELDHLLHDFFHNRLPAKGPETVFLFDNFEENLAAADIEAPIPADADQLPALDDKDTARFLADLICAGKTRVLITSRYPFKLPDNQHEALTRIDLNTLSIAETRKLMSRLKGFDLLDNQQRAQVVSYIGGHPLTLELLDAIQREGRFTYPDVHRRLLKKLPEDALDRLNRSEALSDAPREAVFLAARDCFVDLLLEGLELPEKELLFLFSVFAEPRPMATLQWLVERRELTVETDAAADKLIRLSLLAPAGDRYTVHRWTAACLEEVMGQNRWRLANRLAGDHYNESEKISINDGMAAWRHYLEGNDPGSAHQAAVGLEARLNARGHWALCRIICKTMLEATRENPLMRAAWLYAAGALDQNQGDHEEALDRYGQALEIFEKQGARNGMAKIYLQIGMIRRDKGDHEGAFDQCRQSLEIYKKLGDQSGMAMTCRQISNLRRLQGDYDEALTQCKQSLEIFETLGDENNMASTCRRMGVIRQEQGDYKAALANYRQSLEISKKPGDQGGMAKTYARIGNLLTIQGDDEGALVAYRQSLKIFKNLGDQSGMAYSCRGMGVIHQARGDHEDAFARFRQALEIFEKLGARSGMAKIYHGMGDLYCLQSDYKGAIAQYRQSLEIFEELGDQGGMAATYQQMGKILQNQDDYEGTLAQYRQSLGIYEELDDRKGMANSCHRMGMILQEQGDYAGALAQHGQSLEIFKDLGDQIGMARSHHEMGNVRYHKGDYNRALARYSQSLEINEKLDDRSGMASSFGRMGLLMQKLGKEQEAFGYFFQAFFIFSGLQAPAASQVARDLCDTARRNPDQWRGWLSELAPDEGSREQVEQLILTRTSRSHEGPVIGDR